MKHKSAQYFSQADETKHIFLEHEQCNCLEQKEINFEEKILH